jgi:hypothetical protein
MPGGGGAVECGSEERWTVWLKEGDVAERRTTNGGRTLRWKGGDPFEIDEAERMTYCPTLDLTSGGGLGEAVGGTNST